MCFTTDLRRAGNKCICTLSSVVVISDLSIHLLMFYNRLTCTSGLVFPVHLSYRFIQCSSLLCLFRVLLYPTVNSFTLCHDEAPVLMWDRAKACGTVSEIGVDVVYVYMTGTASNSYFV